MQTNDFDSLFAEGIASHVRAVEALRSQSHVLRRAAVRMLEALRDGRSVMWCGNGGSAADSQHLAAELVGRFSRNRRALASISLTTDTSILTAVSNDFGFDHVFSRQVEALCKQGDVVVALSTSGNSRNVCLAMESAKRLGAYTFAMTGGDGGQLAKAADECLVVSEKVTARIQEAHIFAGHILCDWVEAAICEIPN